MTKKLRTTQRIRTSEARPYVCNGGPCSGQTLYLATGATLPFTLGGVRGMYVSEATRTMVRWQPK